MTLPSKFHSFSYNGLKDIADVTFICSFFFFIVASLGGEHTTLGAAIGRKGLNQSVFCIFLIYAKIILN